MDDLVWILVAVIGLAVSVASKAMKQQGGGRSQDAPKWPGPVAGPRPGQGPTWAPAPGSRPTLTPRPQAPAPGKAEVNAQPQPVKTLVSGDVFTRSLDAEGYGSEGVGSEGQGIEGPGPADGVEEELNRFSRESEQFAQRQLNRLSDDLVRPDDAPAVVTAYEGTSADMQAALGGADSLARAILLSEVLGKPKALRRRGVR